MPICLLKRGDLCDRMSSRENEARFLHQNEVKFARQRRQNGCQPRFVPHAFAQEAQQKHKIRLAVSHWRPQISFQKIMFCLFTWFIFFFSNVVPC